MGKSPIVAHTETGDSMLHKAEILPRDKDVGCYCGGVPNWRVALVHYAAKIAGLHVKLEGMPIGTNRNLEAIRQGQAKEGEGNG